MSHLSTPLTPKNRRKLLVLFVCRISTVHQDIRSFADQKALCREWLTQHTDMDPESSLLRDAAPVKTSNGKTT